MDRWKRKEAIKTMAGYVRALSLLCLDAVESPENNPSDILRHEPAIVSKNFFGVPVKGMQPSCKHLVPSSFSFVTTL